MLKKLARLLLLALYNLLVVWAVLYFGFWIGHRNELLLRDDKAGLEQRLEPPRHMDTATMRLLGAMHQEKASSFINFEQAKPADCIRVCALGDSHTQGDEVGEHHDYPSYLQRMFREHGFERVQVLNFGNGWFGFSQIYVMWKNVARKFGCDYVTLLPMDFWQARDTTFNHSEGLYPGYLHARLIVENDQLRLIAPLGETGEQRQQEYLRPIPHWQYLRYDLHPPNIFDAPLPGERTIFNPFYHDRRPGPTEVTDIHARVIRAIADDGPQLIVLFRGRQQELYPGLIPAPSADIGTALLDESSDFPYLAPARHPSAWGQELAGNGVFRTVDRGQQDPVPDGGDRGHREPLGRRGETAARARAGLAGICRRTLGLLRQQNQPGPGRARHSYVGLQK